MKKTILTVASLIVCITFLQAQTLKINDVNKTKRNSYNVTESRFGQSIAIKNKNNTHHRDRRTCQLSDIKFDKSDKTDLIYNIKQVFGEARMSELIGERLTVDVLITLNSNKVSEVSFSSFKNTKITITELEALEDAIKKNVVIKFNKENVVGCDFATISVMVPFRTVLNGTFSY